MGNKARQIDFLLSGYRDPDTDTPLSGGKVYTYLDGTSTLSSLWTDRDKGGSAANPVVLDSNGQAEVYGDNAYKFIIKDSDDVTIETINGIDSLSISGASGITFTNDTDISSNGWFLDEDDMVSDDDTKVPSQQSVKAYIVKNIRTNTLRSKFKYKATNEIYINGGRYAHQGSIEQFVYWDSQLTYQFTSLAIDTWSYLYIDDSAVVAAGTNLLTASEFTDSTTEPTWSNSKKGWYNGNDRCIFAVLGDGSGNITNFSHVNNFVSYDERITELSLTDIDTTWTDITLTFPGFAIHGEACFFGDGNGHTIRTFGYWRQNGSAGGGQVVAVYHSSVSNNSINTVNIITDTSQTIEFKYSNSGGGEIEVSNNGWYLPIGM